ncbi:MAG: ribosome maturation factor RimM [Bacteroidales bacterium]|nr:ribosome maturation factor RimM [Bacteroidales bacterium]MCM1146922.1 ribosome maturation factor RimM [Bacteroidales bacterium]MCM1205580.1 ribosome maturation factor RimM [Bacillota bacterium]MCM1510309.1 ribosome maturation factor RimM [Clostridium sp.]
MIKDSDVYRIGRVGKPHGVKGEVQVQIDDDVFDRVGADYLVLRIDGILVPFFMEEYRFKSDEIALVTFCDMDSAEKVRELTGCEVFFPRSLADEVEHDLTYAELVGYQLVDSGTGMTVGTVEAVDDSTENILFELDNGCLIPAPEELIEEVDTESRKVTVAVPEGLLDMDE